MAKTKSESRAPVIVLLIVGYLMLCVVGTLYVFEDGPISDGPLPIKTFATIFFVVGPLLLLLLGVVEGIVEWLVRRVIALFKKQE